MATSESRATWSERAAAAIRRSKGAVPLTGNPNATLRRLWRVGCWVEQRMARRAPLTAKPSRAERYAALGFRHPEALADMMEALMPAARVMPVDLDDLNRLYDRLEAPAWVPPSRRS